MIQNSKYTKQYILKRGLRGGANGREPACQCRRHKMHVRSLGREDPLEEGMTTYSSILACKIPWIQELGRLYSTGAAKSGTLSD